MRVESVNVGQVREVEWRGQVVSTGIFKAPVEGRIRAEGVNLTGDRQADLRVHGGPDMAIYAYPAEHYEAWAGELEGEQRALVDTPGAFGENLTLRGLLESEAGIGDRFRVGGALLRVTIPRVPCFKLGIRFGDPAFIRRFHEAGRNGWYFAIEEPGEIGAGDAIERVGDHDASLTIHHLVELFGGQESDPALRRTAAGHPALPEGWRRRFRDE